MNIACLYYVQNPCSLLNEKVIERDKFLQYIQFQILTILKFNSQHSWKDLYDYSMITKTFILNRKICMRYKNYEASDYNLELDSLTILY